MIISASRRTDIPAFFMPWFMNRIQAGVVSTRNPFNPKQISTISLTLDTVDAIVFWTRDARNLLPYLDTLDALGFRYYVHYTIMGYPQLLEPHVPLLTISLDTFSALSKRIGMGRVIWRYDPIFLSSLTPIAHHKRLFQEIAKKLEGKTKRVVISFTDFYAKTKRHIKTVPDLEYSETLDQEQLDELITYFIDTARDYGLAITSCTEPLLHGYEAIAQGACVDATLLQEEFQFSPSLIKDRNQRPNCHCIRSVDIGAYNTCAFDCVYCYATTSAHIALQNRKQHNRDGKFLVGM